METRMGIALPEDTVVLHDETGERDPEMKHRCWVLCSETGFSLSPEVVPQPHMFLPDDGKTIAECIKALLGGGSLPETTAALSVQWSHGSYDFRAGRLKTRKQEYLLIEQFARK